MIHRSDTGFWTLNRKQILGPFGNPISNQPRRADILIYAEQAESPSRWELERRVGCCDEVNRLWKDYMRGPTDGLAGDPYLKRRS
jgi:hypothetical protein